MAIEQELIPGKEYEIGGDLLSYLFLEFDKGKAVFVDIYPRMRRIHLMMIPQEEVVLNGCRVLNWSESFECKTYHYDETAKQGEKVEAKRIKDKLDGLR